MAASAPVAVVLAGSRGIGRAAAEALAASGHSLVICGRNRETLEASVAAIEARGVEAEAVVADLGDEEATVAVVERALEVGGRIDVLVANSGGPRPGSFEELSSEDWHEAFRLSFMSVVASVRAAIPPMSRQGRGRIVVVGSSSVRVPLAGLTLSNAFRPALDGLVKSLAAEHARAGITVNMVAPGKVDTDRVRELDERRASLNDLSYAEQRRRTEERIPAGRYGRPQEMGALVAFLASDDAAYLTGQCILLDGGDVPTLP